MHPSALANAKRFFAAYQMDGATVLDIGAQDVNGSLRHVCPHNYVGVDFVDGNGVDVVLSDPYKLPFPDNSQDIIVSSSCFEHSEFFWVLFLEIIRILKPNGLLYINVPSNGDVHRYPVDCWRFYPDSANALANWARRNGFNTVALEHYTSDRDASGWNDYVAVFVKDEKFADQHPGRITKSFRSFRNASSGERSIAWTQDQDSPLWIARRIGYLLRQKGGMARALSIWRERRREGRSVLTP